MNYNFLIIEDVSGVPFPQEVQPLLKEIKWADFVWNTSGFPEIGGTYSLLNGKTLYLDMGADGNSKVQKQEFSGEVSFGGYFFTEDKEGDNYIITFKAIFLKGELIEISHLETKPHSAQEYDKAATQMNEDLGKRLKQERAWWFKYLYKPYKNSIRWLAIAFLWCLHMVDAGVRKFVLWITPL